MTNIAAVILSAGESTRMGAPKALLTIEEKTLLEDQIQRIEKAGIDDIYIVVGADAERIIHFHEDLNVVWVTNEDWKLGNFSSIKTAMKSIADQDYEGSLLLPIDTVGVPPKTIRNIWQAGHRKGKNIIPTINDRGGHPVYLTRDLVMDIAYKLSFSERLDEVFYNNTNTERLDVFSKNIHNNINTPEEWKAYLATLTN